MPIDPQKIRIQELANKYLKGQLTHSEQLEFDEWFKNEGSENIYIDANIAESEDKHRQLILSRINEQIKSVQDIKVKTIWPRIAAAASILLCISLGGYFILNKKPTQQIAKNQKQEILPGTNKATLTLANGQKIILTRGLNGRLAQQGSALVQVNSSKSITYTASGINSSLATQVQFNTLSTVRGEQSPYPLVLADGTKVWLNAESSITFPTSFSGNERVVKITGEVYFEVVHDALHPFKVKVRDQTIEDLGTQFNINAYQDEPTMKTTLINGKVKISVGSQATLLKPGFQAVVSPSGSSIIVQAADLDEVMAWKNGNFEFEGTPLKDIMRQISRWYDVDISYKGTIEDAEFGGSISRTKNINEILSVLETTKGVHFELEGRRILVMP
ncbi:FecR family protein [Mucilaginibacter sp. L196]|uniref:FecR family protein n=1 Tax=Mucilaginibacter sp. L196 TaxID=1641870 RepID=UPI00131C8460|nr:FecR family protein [Mucilaginibacter sp. L196]